MLKDFLKVCRRVRGMSGSSQHDAYVLMPCITKKSKFTGATSFLW
jgi:hypothetical protein